ncbi:protein tyrosine phosphatase [Acinetobacter sp. NCu2D-2]|uniref:low molecular weight protein-tyrosine-phosphatase n=1 Tax=Acinetobacter sp. NCu2D-2 TaxID=1608473 RepID=UPI0007CDB1B9|nr:low molecular weight protein-tyrosine-phosphatase [Acinetobacter sp. NCu2D-2]ANF82908.1 protein tyrosine phosphatase [Acinetobacter sp. NCu2D-2]
MQFKNILVVCVGNICRSPMAEYFFKESYPELNIQSAGIAAMVGHPADVKAKQCMQDYGINIDAHIAQKLNAQLIKQADLILVMSKNQQQHIEQQWPFAKGKIFRLGHWRHQNISDPYQHDQQFFNETCQLIKQCVNDWKTHF